MTTPFRHELRVRYAEVDMQGHVFNAHYLTYCDDACTAWLRDRLGPIEEMGFDLVVKAANLTFHRGAGFDAPVAVDVSVARWGRTSVDVRFEGSVGEEPTFSATLTYVTIAPGSLTPTPLPEAARAVLS